MADAQPSDKIQELIASLLSDASAPEAPLLQWLTQILECEPIPSFLRLAENPTHLMRLAALTKLHLAAPTGDRFTDAPSIVSFVALLADVWNAKKSLRVFAFFDDYLHGQLNPAFVFETDFDSLLYSHSQTMVHVVLIATLLTTFLLDQGEEEEGGLAVFGRLAELPPDTRDFLEVEFKQIVALFGEISAGFEPEPETASEPFAIGESERARKGAPVNDMHLLKKIEEQAKLMEALNERLVDSEKTVLQLRADLDKQSKELEEKTREAQKLTFSRDDLLEKLKNKQLGFVNDIVEEKEMEIRSLRDRLEQHAALSQAKLRDLEDDRENLHKKIHQLENHKKELEGLRAQSLQRAPEAPKENIQPYKDEIQSLRDKIGKLQEASLADKEKGLNLEMTISKLNIELHGLTIAKQNLDFRVKELESLDEAGRNADLLLDDYELIARELSSAGEASKATAALAHKAGLAADGDPSSGERQLADFLSSDEAKKHISTQFESYERRCLSQIRTLLGQLKEAREELAEASKDFGELKTENEDLAEKASQLEAATVEKMIDRSPQIQELLRQLANSNKEGSEIAQDLLKTILKREQEIGRLRANCRRLNEEIVSAEGRSLETIELIYTITDAFFGS